MSSIRTVHASLVALALALACAPGCGEDHGHEEDELDAEVCGHLEDGPATAVTASATADGSAPNVSKSHTRFDVTLVDFEKGKGGYVAFTPRTATDHVIYVTEDISVAVLDADLQVVALEASAKSSAACALVKGRHVVELGASSHFVQLGGVGSVSEVSLIVEEAAHDDP